MIKYSHKYTVNNGTTYLSSFGMYFILLLIPVKGCTYSFRSSFDDTPPSPSRNAAVDEDDAKDGPVTSVVGLRSKKKKARACKTGTISIRSKHFFGVKPMAIRAAYVNAPATPAAPVPDDHVDTTLLKFKF